MLKHVFSAVVTVFLLFSCASTTMEKGGASVMKETGAELKFKWTTGEPVILPQPEEGREVVSAKDPSPVFYNGKWHVFYTTCDTKGVWSMQFISFKDWKDAGRAKAYPKDNNPNLRGYHCAPQVFYFTPQKKWYMIFQSGQPQYTTNDDINNPDGWTSPRDFFKGPVTGLEQGQWGNEWLDFSFIADKKNAYLFFTGDNGRFYRCSTRIENFPDGMSNPEMVLYSRDRGMIFEGSATYRIKGQEKYLTIIEAFDQSSPRFYRSFTADKLDGEWKEQAGSFDNPFAGIRNVTFEDGVKPWTKDISHGEIIRDGYDESMTIDMDNLQMLIQGRAPESDGMPYHMLPYKIGLLKSVK